MTIPNPDHLLDQSERLIDRPQTGGSPRQTDLRRSVSSSYYGVFHAVLAGVADQFVGATLRSTSEYGRVYRSVDHRTLRLLCDDVRRKSLPAKYTAHAPQGGFGADVTECARATADLQDMRSLADYDPLSRFGVADALLALKVARTALTHLRRAPAGDRRAFYSLVLFPPRR